MPRRARREFRRGEGASATFWAIWLSGRSLTVHYGRVGRPGRRQTWRIASPAVAETDYERRVRRKLHSGYREHQRAPAKPRPRPLLSDRTLAETPRGALLQGLLDKRPGALHVLVDWCSEQGRSLVAVDRTPRACDGELERSRRTGLWCPALAGPALRTWWREVPSVRVADATVREEHRFRRGKLRRVWRDVVESGLAWRLELRRDADSALHPPDGQPLRHQGGRLGARWTELVEAGDRAALRAWVAREDQALVWLEEEYGYRHWLWLPLMAPDELETWWLDLETVHPFFADPSRDMPGWLIQRPYDCELARCDWLYRAHTHDDSDSYLRRPGGAELQHAGAYSI